MDFDLGFLSLWVPIFLNSAVTIDPLLGDFFDGRTDGEEEDEGGGGSDRLPRALTAGDGFVLQPPHSRRILFH